MNWPSSYSLVGDSLICDISSPEEAAGVVLLNHDPRKQAVLPDCYVGTVKEAGARCKLVRVGDRIVFTRWIYSQSDLDDARICLREVDVVIVNDRCVNGFIAVKIYKPFKKIEELIQVEGRRAAPERYYWGQIIDIDHGAKNNPETSELKEGNIILFQKMDDYQYFIGQHTLVFKNMYDVPLLVLESLQEEKELSCVG